MSCGTAPSCQHWQRTSCSGSSKVVLQCLINSGGIPSLPGALPEAKLFVTTHPLSQRSLDIISLIVPLSGGKCRPSGNN